MCVDRSPFPYQGPLLPEQVAGRDDLIADLAERLMQRRVTALLGPRRYGKTSVLKKVAADLAEVGPDTVWIDLYELSSMADLAAAVDRGLAATSGPLRRAFDAVAASIEVRLGVVGVQLTKGRRDRPEPAALLRSLLDVLVSAASKQQLLVVFDEFSGIAAVDGAAGALRTGLQHHYQELGLAFAGSEPSMMRTLFSDQAQPFFAQADLVEIGPLPDAAVAAAVDEGFERTDRRIDAAVVSQLASFADGHPQRAMQLADALWRETPERGEATPDTWLDALEAVRSSVDIGSERLYALLPPGHQKVLRVLASGGSVYGTAAEVLDLAPGTARAAVDALLGNGFLTRRGERIVLVDPLLSDWIRRRFSA